MILLRDALNSMDTGEPFHVTVVTCDQERGTGGKIIKFGPAILNQPRRKKGNGKSAVRIKKKRNNYDHNTRTIRILGSDQIRTIHVQLIIEFNGEKVI